MHSAVNFVLLLAVCSTQAFFWPTLEEQEKLLCSAKPQSDNKLQVEYDLYTKGNRVVPKRLTTDPTIISNSGFSSAKNTKFIIHGYTDSGSVHWISSMRDAILDVDDVNIIVVNWEKGADSLSYPQSAANTLRVGQLVAAFIQKLHEATGVNYASFHLIGHSLGAHICGFAGASLNGALGRITGMDPAGPCFQYASSSNRLNSNQAVFVDVIHTNADLLFRGGIGIDRVIGDADYFPNGGRHQPGCTKSPWKHVLAFFQNWVSGLSASFGCSHGRVTDLFQESVSSSTKFIAYPCDNPNNYKTCTTCRAGGCSKMGYYAPTNSRGVYTLRTNSAPPYSVN